MNSSMVKEIIRNEIDDWDDDLIATARFKALNGQRSDWEPKYFFWRDLILKIARQLGVFILHPSQVKNDWFNRGGLTPLCLDHVLNLMYSEGDILRNVDLVDPTSGRVSQLFRKVRNLVVRSSTTSDIMLEDHVILTALLKEKATEVTKVLSESHWGSSCIVTMREFQETCGGPKEASLVLGYLSGVGKARYISFSKKEFLEGVKVSLSAAPASTISNLDLDFLHLIWTAEKLEQQIGVIDKRYEISRTSALASLKSGNKKVALRYAKEMKLASESREKCTSLLNRVEEVLNAITTAESTKKVTEAVKIGAQAVKQNRITVEEVDLCLEELEEAIDSQKQIEKAFESTPSYTDLEDEDMEEEFKKLEFELGTEDLQPQVQGVGVSGTSGLSGNSELADSLTNAMSDLRIHGASTKESINQGSAVATRTNDVKRTAVEEPLPA
ncbi:SNF7 family protein [Euphorbia peplus]|nr:SNF7 family protein [Euphorbia peplus]